jgi:isopenicillin-N N-acyltransferase like protein
MAYGQGGAGSAAGAAFAVNEAMAAGLPFYRVAGSGARLGAQHGELLRRQIAAFVADDLQRLNKLKSPAVTIEQLSPLLQQYRASIERQLPYLGEEVHGLASGAGLSLEQAYLLQLRREILGFSKLTSSGDCTTFARSGKGSRDCALAQTVDLNGELESEAYVVEVTDAAADGRSLLLLTFTGLLGYLGLNSHGLAMGLNLVMGGDWRPGVPAYMAIRHVLQTATCVDEGVELLRRLDLASSRAFMLCDPEQAVNVEVLENQLQVQRSAQLIHTNHFLSPQFEPHDQINVFARNGSRLRLGVCARALEALPSPAHESDYFSVLERPEICVPPDGNPRREATVARVVIEPRLRRLWVKRGSSPAAPTRRFQLEVS